VVWVRCVCAGRESRHVCSVQERGMAYVGHVTFCCVCAVCVLYMYIACAMRTWCVCVERVWSMRVGLCVARVLCLKMVRSLLLQIIRAV
jgi:hypothetical protein